MGKYKKLIELFAGVILLLFLGIYFGQATGYYKFAENRKTTLTEEAIERFEADVKEGKEIIASNYLIKEKNYNNNISFLCMKISSFIEKSFNRFMNLVFKELEEVVNGE